MSLVSKAFAPDRFFGRHRAGKKREKVKGKGYWTWTEQGRRKSRQAEERAISENKPLFELWPVKRWNLPPYQFARDTRQVRVHLQSPVWVRGLNFDSSTDHHTAL